MKLEAVGTEGVECIECDACNVCRLGFRSEVGDISIGLMSDEKSRSSLLSDCTRGLVGGFMTKLEEKDEDSDGARDPTLSRSIGGNLGSN